MCSTTQHVHDHKNVRKILNKFLLTNSMKKILEIGKRKEKNENISTYAASSVAFK